MRAQLTRAFLRWRSRGETKKLQAASVGAGSVVDPSVQVLGWKQVKIGRNVVLGEHGWLNVNDRENPAVAIEIGDHSFIGRRNFFNAGALIRLGPYCLTGLDCHFLGSDHVHTTPFAPYISTGNTLHQRIIIGANCWLGASVTVLGDVEIGFGSIIGAGAVVTASVPPFSIVVGNPARVIKRFDPAKETWVPVAEWSDRIESLIPSAAEYEAQLIQKYGAPRQPRVASSSRYGDL